ncbi:hypothetical protein TRVA0_049S00386 [Trichomonascus vanleenenianus]|uniref:uncharacterized protein n=1 Tax=Trichomonascus vanleenenianus TaxID=2268995 RepID=UPI003ECB1E90
MVISNKYYEATVDIWIDEFDDDGKQWSEVFASEEASEAREVIGSVIATFDPKNPLYKSQLESIGRFISRLEDEEWDGSAFAVSEGPLQQEADEDWLFDLGMEHVNQLAESKKLDKDGIERIKEGLEAYPWPTNDGFQEVENQPDEGSSETKLEKENGDEFDEPLTKEDVDTFYELVKKLNYTESMIDSEERVDKLDEFMKKLAIAKEHAQNVDNTQKKQLSEQLADELLKLI